MQTWRRWPPMLVPALAAVGAARVSAQHGKSAPRGEFSPNVTMPISGDPARGLGTLSVRERRPYVASRRMRAAPLHARYASSISSSFPDACRASLCAASRSARSRSLPSVAAPRSARLS